MPDPVHGEKVIAFVSLRDGFTTYEQELQDLVRSRVSRWLRSAVPCVRS